MIASKPIQPQTVMTMIEYSAPSELSKNPNGPSPTLPRTQLASPKLGSNSHRNMIVVAIVETTTGMKTASR